MASTEQPCNHGTTEDDTWALQDFKGIPWYPYFQTDIYFLIFLYPDDCFPKVSHYFIESDVGIELRQKNTRTSGEAQFLDAGRWTEQG